MATLPMETPDYLYRISSPQEWQESQNQNEVIKTEIDSGALHLSTQEQLPGRIEKYWKKKEYLILKIDPKRLVGQLKLEANPGGTNLYYHLYDGKIPLDAVIEVDSSGRSGS